MKATINGVEFTLEVANKPDELAKGLMFRNVVPNRTGMLFVFPEKSVQSMWMKNTFVGLDILFCDDSTTSLSNELKILTIHQNAKPRDLTRISSQVACKYAIELPAYSVAYYKIKPGQNVLLQK